MSATLTAAELEALRPKLAALKAELEAIEGEMGPAPSDAEVDEITYKRDQRCIAEMDDVTLVFVLLGLMGEMEGAPGWGRTETARRFARMTFSEIATRWLPPDVYGEAFDRLMEDVEATP